MITTTTPHYAEAVATRRNYADWSVEELRAFALQLQLPGAARKNRGELVAIFTALPRTKQ